MTIDDISIGITCTHVVATVWTCFALGSGYSSVSTVESVSQVMKCTCINPQGLEVNKVKFGAWENALWEIWDIWLDDTIQIYWFSNH